MVITLDLPDDIARALTERGNLDLSRRALEALAVQEYTEKRLTQKQVGELLALSRIQTEDFLARHVDLHDCDPADLPIEAQRLKDFSEGR